MHPQSTQSNDAPKFMLYKCFCTKQVLENTFWKIRRIQSKYDLKPLLSQNMVHFT